jgi:uncharacterized protein (TIGR03083 family)
MELETYLDHVRGDAALLLAAARSDPTAPVPSCPEWDTNALLGHTGKVHHWVAHILETGASERPTRQFGKEVPADFAACASWYEDGVVELLAAFAATEPDGVVWNWSDGKPAPARWWFRRMAHETTAHRWDGQNAVGVPDGIDPELAADGIDEYLGFVAADLAAGGIEGVDRFAGSLSLVPTDHDGSWHLHFTPNHLDRNDDARTCATLTGSVSDLYLWLLRRASVDSPGLKVEGDQSAVSMWDVIKF